MKISASTVLAASLAWLYGCSPGQAPDTAPAPAATAISKSIYSDPRQGFAIPVPDGMQLRHDFQRSYLTDASWKAFAGPDTQGAPAMALVMDGSNPVTAAELRIGIGSDDEALADCLDAPASGATTTLGTTTLDGVPFTHFHAADAAMSHYLEVDGYRTVHANRCYAIDLLISGTRPEVYDPPATPPFTRTEAEQQLHKALDGFHFLPDR